MTLSTIGRGLSLGLLTLLCLCPGRVQAQAVATEAAAKTQSTPMRIALLSDESAVELPSAESPMPLAGQTESLLASLRLAGQCLAVSQSQDGRLLARRDPTGGQPDVPANAAEQAAGLDGLLQVYQVTGDAAFLQAAKRGLPWLLQQVTAFERDGRRMAAVVEQDVADLGANAMTVIAVARYIQLTDDLTHLETIKRIGRWMQSLQTPEGFFRIHRQSFPLGITQPYSSKPYLGQAVAALVWLHDLDPLGWWLETARSAMIWHIQDREADRLSANLEFNPWLLTALEALHRRQPSELFPDYARRCGAAIRGMQVRADDDPRWVGGFATPVNPATTADCIVGLAAVYRLLRDYQPGADLSAYLSALQQGVAFQQRMQLDEQALEHHGYPSWALGGFPAALNDPTILAGNVRQHVAGLAAFHHLMSPGQNRSTGEQ